MGSLLSRKKPGNRAEYVQQNDYRNRNSNNPNSAAGQTESILKDLALEETVTAIACCGPHQCIVGDSNGALLCYDITSGRVNPCWSGHTKSITKICWNQKLERVFSASRDLTVKMWSLEYEDKVQEFKGQHELVISAVAVNQEATQMCTGSRDNSVALWDLSTGVVIMNTSIARNLVTDIVWAEDCLVQASEDKTVRLWDTRTLEVVKTFTRKQQIITSCDVRGNYILSSSSGMNGSGCEITLWDRRGGEVSPLFEFRGHTEKVHKAAFLAADKDTFIVSVSADQTVRLWDSESKQSIASLAMGLQLSTINQISSDNALCFCVGTIENGVKVVTLDHQTNQFKRG